MFLVFFFAKNKAKREISDIISVLTPYMRRKFSQNVTVFSARCIVFCVCFFRLKYSDDFRHFQSKPLMIERQFSQHVTVFLARYIVFFVCFFTKNRANRGISDITSWKPFILEGQFSQNVTVFAARCIMFFVCFFFAKDRAKREILYIISVKTPNNRTTIFTKCNGFFN